MFSRIVPVVALAFGLVATAPASAQDITETHLEAAVEALRASPGAESYKILLPAVGDRVKSQLILIRPDLHLEIGAKVDEVAARLEARLAELEAQVARVWAQSFTEDELVTIAEFYNSPAGQKFAEVGTRVVSESFQVAEAWGREIERELFDTTREEMQAAGQDF